VRRAERQTGSSTPLGITLFAFIEYIETDSELKGETERSELKRFHQLYVRKDVEGKIERGAGVAYFANKVLSQHNHRDITHSNPIGFDQRELATRTHTIRYIYTVQYTWKWRRVCEVETDKVAELAI